MKKLTLIVPTNVEQMLADRLRSLKQVSGFTFTHVEGHSPQDERDSAVSVRDLVVGYTPQVRVEILLSDEDVPAVLDAVRCHGGVVRGGVYWVVAVEEQGRL